MEKNLLRLAAGNFIFMIVTHLPNFAIFTFDCLLVRFVPRELLGGYELQKVLNDLETSFNENLGVDGQFVGNENPS